MSKSRLNPTEAQTQKAIIVIVQGIPPTVNHYVKHTRRGRHYVSADALQFKAQLTYEAHGQTITAKEYGVTIRIYLGRLQKGDIDNFPKCVLDGLKEAKVIHSDAAVTRLLVAKFRDRGNPRTEIEVIGLAAQGAKGRTR